MDTSIAKNISEKFLASAFESLEALLGVPYTFSASDPANLNADKVALWAKTQPVWMHARILGGGAAALMWRMSDAAALAAQVSGEDPTTKALLDDADRPLLKELTDAILGGGVAGLSTLLGEDVQLEEAACTWNEDAAALVDAVGDALSGVEVSFESGGHTGTLMLVFSHDLVTRVASASEVDVADERIVSDDEMKDILSGFTPDDEPDHAGGPVGPSGPMPDNLSVIMDIELVATARLGKVDVPIAEILKYGPGSIIEMGHLVDEPVELLVNGKLIARGDVVVVDEKFGLRITEIVSPQERIESLR